MNRTSQRLISGNLTETTVRLKDAGSCWSSANGETIETGSPAAIPIRMRSVLADIQGDNGYSGSRIFHENPREDALAHRLQNGAHRAVAGKLLGFVIVGLSDGEDYGAPRWRLCDGAALCRTARFSPYSRTPRRPAIVDPRRFYGP